MAHHWIFAICNQGPGEFFFLKTHLWDSWLARCSGSTYRIISFDEQIFSLLYSSSSSLSENFSVSKRAFMEPSSLNLWFWSSKLLRIPEMRIRRNSLYRILNLTFFCIFNFHYLAPFLLRLGGKNLYRWYLIGGGAGLCDLLQQNAEPGDLNQPVHWTPSTGACPSFHPGS